MSFLVSSFLPRPSFVPVLAGWRLQRKAWRAQKKRAQEHLSWSVVSDAAKRLRAGHRTLLPSSKAGILLKKRVCGHKDSVTVSPSVCWLCEGTQVRSYNSRRLQSHRIHIHARNIQNTCLKEDFVVLRVKHTQAFGDFWDEALLIWEGYRRLHWAHFWVRPWRSIASGGMVFWRPLLRNTGWNMNFQLHSPSFESLPGAVRSLRAAGSGHHSLAWCLA